jgi:hypothetical protein
LATDPQGAEFALKCLHSTDFDARERFEREVLLLNKCNHPNIVRFWASDLSEWVALTYANDGTLETRPKRLDTSSLREIFLPIAGALDYFRGLAGNASEPQQHRDVKPSNILFHNGTPLLSDFGVALKPGSDLTKAGARVGTDNYSAPEQMQGKSSSAIDQYALATIIYEWLAGRLPFVDPEEKLRDRAPSQPLVEKGIDARVQAVLFRALATQPEDRYPSCMEFMNAIVAAFGPPGGAATNPGVSPETADVSDAFSKFKNAQEVYDSLAARLLRCEFSGPWASEFKTRFAKLHDEHMLGEHKLAAPIEITALVDWLRKAPPLDMRFLFFAIAEGLPIPADEQTQKLVLELLVFAACRMLNLDCFLSAPTRCVNDPNFPGAQVRDWPTSASSIAGVVHSALSGQFITVDRHCKLAGAIEVKLAKVQSADGQSEILTLLYRELLDRPFDPAILVADEEAARLRKATAAWAPVRKALSDRTLKKQSVVIVLVPPEEESIDPAEQKAMAHNLARRVNATLLQLRPEPATMHVLDQSDLLLEIQKVLEGFAPLNDSTSKPVDPAIQYDLFLSYASKDRDFVSPLVMYLQKQGVHVWVDYGEIRLGDDLIQKINDGLKRSRFCVALLSEHYLQRGWTQLELGAALAREMNGPWGTSRVLLPVRHGLSLPQLTSEAPWLAARIFADSSEGPARLADLIRMRIRG